MLIHIRGLGDVLYDEQDHELVRAYSWHRISGYATTSVKGADGKWRPAFMHRMILAAPHDKRVDHANGRKTDNRRANLRFASPAENARNKAAQRGRLKGVRPRPDGSFNAHICIDYDEIYLGAYQTPEAAAAIYDAAAVRAFGQFARINGAPDFVGLDRALATIKRTRRPLPVSLFHATESGE